MKKLMNNEKNKMNDNLIAKTTRLWKNSLDTYNGQSTIKINL